MTTKQLIERLEQYNPDAKVTVIAHNRCHDFTLCFGGADGCAPNDAETVDLCVDALNASEANVPDEPRRSRKKD